MGNRLRIGLIGPGLAHHDFRPVVEGAARAVGTGDNRLLVFGARRSLRGTVLRSEVFSEQAVVTDFVDPKVVDGIIVFVPGLMPSQSEAGIVDFVRGLGVPTVLIGVEADGLPSVTVDFAEGFRRMLTHVVEVHGVRRIAGIVGSSGLPEDSARLDALRSAARSIGTDLMEIDSETSRGRSSTVADVLDALLTRGPSAPDAVFCESDGVAVVVIDELAKRGIRVPDDMIVVGFGDTRDSERSDLPITTLRYDYGAVGAAAVSLCVDCVLDGASESLSLELIPVYRRSCGCSPWAADELRDSSVASRPEFSSAVRAIDAAVESGDVERLRRDLERLTATSDFPGEELLYRAIDESRIGPTIDLTKSRDVSIRAIVEMVAANTAYRRERKHRMIEDTLVSDEMMLGRRLDELVDTEHFPRTLKTVLTHLGVADYRILRITGGSTAAIISASDDDPTRTVADGPESLIDLMAEVGRSGGSDTILSIVPLPFNADTLGYAFFDLKPEYAHITDTLASSLGSFLNRLRLVDMLDRTEAARRTAYLKQVETQKQLVQSQRLASLGRLVANVAHQLNTPLGIAVTAVSHLRTIVQRMTRSTAASGCCPDDGETCANLVGLIENSVRRTADIVAKFGSIAPLIDTADRPETNVREIVDTVFASLRTELESAGILVDIDIPRPIRFCIPPDSLERILFALVSNSLEHAFDECRNRGIKIRVVATDDGAEIEYSDSGGGVDETILSELFEPFFTTKRAEGNLGLGLHAVYNMVTGVFKGTVRAQSPPGQGLTIRIGLPKDAVRIEAAPDRGDPD